MISRIRTRSASTLSISRLRVYYDGGCPLCVKEIGLYKNLNEHFNKIEFYDAQDEVDDYLKTKGVSHETAMYKLHAVELDSKEKSIHIGYPAFVEMWKRLG